MKRLLIFIIACSAALALFLWVNKSYKMIDMSDLEVAAGASLSIDSVKVTRGFYSINRRDDQSLFANRPGDWVVFDGVNERSLNTDYGENDFLVTYASRYYLVFRHWIFNSNHQHDYHFLLEQTNGSLSLTVDISGPDAMKFTRPMQPINQANGLLGNGPIDPDKVIYNMVEMEKSNSAK